MEPRHGKAPDGQLDQPDQPLSPEWNVADHTPFLELCVTCTFRHDILGKVRLISFIDDCTSLVNGRHRLVENTNKTHEKTSTTSSAKR